MLQAEWICGTRKGIELEQAYIKKCNVKHEKYNILKCDIQKFFASIDHDILKSKLKRKIKDKDALEIIFKIIDRDKQGLSIGNMTSQVFAIFYLNDLDYYIKEKLKIKYYVRYQDDFLLFHNSKKYLKECFEEIKIFLSKEELVLNSKSRMYTNKNNFTYLGRTMTGRYARYREARRKIKEKQYWYRKKKVKLNSLASSMICYGNIL